VTALTGKVAGPNDDLCVANEDLSGPSGDVTGATGEVARSNGDVSTPNGDTTGLTSGVYDPLVRGEEMLAGRRNSARDGELGDFERAD